ncbi:hypothetical protein L210DRAFT_3309597, partial [Boletus edulis BED1]
MVALLCIHDTVMHFEPANHADDYKEKELAKAWFESKSCPAWRNGFLCVDYVDGTTTPFFQKPGYHGEGFYNCKSCYLLSSQIVILLHNLKIVDYTIGVPESINDASAFQ